MLLAQMSFSIQQEYAKEKQEMTEWYYNQAMPIPTIGKAFQVLDFLAQSSSPRNLKEIHESLHLPKTSTYSILKSLVVCGIVRRTPEGKYLPGIRLYTLGTRARVALEDGHLLLPRLRQLRDEIGHTIFFSLYENGDQIVWEKVDGPGSVLFRAYRGERKRLNTSSGGKAIAAYLPKEELEVVLRKGFSNATSNSITSEDAFLKHLEEIRENGYAIDDEEDELGVYCIGAPVFDKRGRIYGAVTMSTLKTALHRTKIDTLIKAIQKAAEDIGNTL